MKKVIIIGCPGSGKSTFARRLAEKTSLPLHYLDMMYWNEDKTTVPKEEFLKRLRKAMDGDEWIIDGNYGSNMEMRLKECDTVFFLDYPREVCLEGVKERRGKKRPDMPWIETGDTDEEFISFVENYNSESRPKVIKLLEQYSSKDIFTFRERKESEDFLKRVE